MADQNNITTLAKRLRPFIKMAVQQVIVINPGDHGLLTGLGDDDHSQYVHNTNARTITAQHSFSPGIAQAPFTLGVNAQSQTVIGLKADELNKSVSAGNGLTGGGNLDSNISLAISLASPSGLEFSSGDLQINDTIAGAGLVISNKILAVGAGNGIDVTADAIAVALATPSGLEFSSGDLQINDTIAGAGLVISNKILAVGAGAGISVNADDVALTTPGTLSISSVNNASGNHTHGITTSDNPGASASILASDSDGYLTLIRLNVDTIADKSGANITISPTGDITLDPGGNDVLPYTNYDINLGSISKKYNTIWAAELWVETLVSQDVIATVGGHVLVAPTTLLVEDCGSGDDHIHVKHNNLADGDRVYLCSDGKIEWMAITSGASGGAGNYSYDVTRDLDSSGANDWYAGDAVLNTGTTGDGYIDIYSVSSIRSGSHYGPSIVGNVRYGTTYSDLIEYWAIGNLNGIYGYGVDTYGAAFGRYASGYSFLTADATNGIRILAKSGGGDTVIAQWAIDGIITIGEVGAGKDNIYISSGAISIRNNATERIGMTAAGIMTIKDSSGNAVLTFDASAGAEITKKLTMPGANSAISIGSTPPTSASVGTGIWIDRTGFYALASNVLQVKIDATNGQLTAGAGHLIIDADGIALKTSTSYSSLAGYNFLNPSGDYMGGLEAYTDPGGTLFFARISIPSANSKSNEIWLDARGDASHYGRIKLYATGKAGSAVIDMFTNDNYGGPYISFTDSPVVFGSTAFSQIGSYGAGDLLISGDLVKVPVYDGYVGYILVPSYPPFTSTSWDGDAYSSSGSYSVIDLSSVFGLPAGIKAIDLEVTIRDAGSATGGAQINFAIDDTPAYVKAFRIPQGTANDTYVTLCATVLCDANGDVYVRTYATGAGTLDVILRIWGYYI